MPTVSTAAFQQRGTIFHHPPAAIRLNSSWTILSLLLLFYLSGDIVGLSLRRCNRLSWNFAQWYIMSQVCLLSFLVQYSQRPPNSEILGF